MWPIFCFRGHRAATAYVRLMYGPAGRGGSLKICLFFKHVYLLLTVTSSAISTCDTPTLSQSKCRTIIPDRKRVNLQWKKHKSAGNISMTARHMSTQISSVYVWRFVSAWLSAPQVWARKLWSTWCQRKDANGEAVSLFPFLSSSGFLLHSTAACFFFFTDGLCHVFPACCNDIPIAGVICQVHFALGLTPRRSAYCVSRGEKHYMSPVFTEQFHPACMRGGLSSEPCLAFKCGKSAQSPPLTRNAARLSSWCSLNKLNNEGISEMPKRHYTPTIRARSE